MTNFQTIILFVVGISGLILIFFGLPSIQKQKPPPGLASGRGFWYLKIMFDVFDATKIDPWQAPRTVQQPQRPDFADNEDLKKAFGIALAKAPNAFSAAAEVFADAMPKALWASINWINDPVVIANRDAYAKTLKKAEKPLDKEELLAEVLQAAKSAIEDKDKASLFKLYAEVAGYIGKGSEISISNNQINNTMKITFVKPENRETKAIDEASNTQSKIVNVDLPKLKLVGGSR